MPARFLMLFCLGSELVGGKVGKPEKSHNQHDGVDDENKDGGGNAKLSIEEKSDTGSSAGNQTGTRDEQYKAGGIHNVADNDHQQFYHVFCSSTHSIHFLTPIICNFA